MKHREGVDGAGVHQPGQIIQWFLLLQKVVISESVICLPLINHISHY